MEPFLTWTHAEVIFTAVGMIAVPLYMGWRSDRKDRNKKHEEVVEAVKSIKEAEKYLPQHYHQEKEGPLTVDGIILKHANGRT